MNILNKVAVIPCNKSIKACGAKEHTPYEITDKEAELILQGHTVFPKGSVDYIEEQPIKHFEGRDRSGSNKPF
ncbi:hypothetical protein J6TS1_37190 [Siminovitchia terrae]|uniref:Uncharacterized protein n=1 Tax=Siminovitchia terrae TaxID=1914933 RepID=A0ABQ4L0W0_SIMTE|nr:hypothetical protein [Siminovitchia terrae]GIN89874.1 hypothetical protein J22TS1_09250 [Siminovitchia terrae]GIN97849.1 hypothetical protein J6TS1_37190 [Siminovitchia terrae]